VSQGPSVCIGSDVQLTSSGGSIYSWSPATGLSNSNISNPVSTPSSSITYTVTVTDVNGCINTGSTTVNVNPLPTPTINPNSQMCFNGNSQLSASGGVTYQWLPTNSLNNSS